MERIKALLATYEQISRLQRKIDLQNLNLDENLCNKCGLCCCEKFFNENNEIEYAQHSCEHLNSDGTCSIYEHRFTIHPSCLNIKQALISMILPAECAYVQANWSLIKTWYKVPKIPNPA